MNRILERITFMVIGALIATLAYLVGYTNRGAEAQAPKELECDVLFVKKMIVVGPRETTEAGSIVIGSHDNVAHISLNSGMGHNPKGQILLITTNEKTGISLANGDVTDATKQIEIGMTGETAIDYAGISIRNGEEDTHKSSSITIDTFEKELAGITIISGSSKNPKSQIWLGTSKEAAGVTLKDNTGANIIR